MGSFEILSELFELYRKRSYDKINLTILFQVDDEEKFLVIDFKQGKITKKKVKPPTIDFEFRTTLETLQTIYDGKMTAFTAAGKSLSTDPAPLDWSMHTELSAEILEQLYSFLMHFFNPSKPEKILLGEKHSRLVHGAHAIPLFYRPGFRSGWYFVKKRLKMNEPGDTNPFPQGVVVMQGKGYAKIGEDTISIKQNEAYFIPPNSDHVFWTEEEEPLILIWLAWGKGA